MKSFWWFKEGSIAGMARPGFNSYHWFDLPFDEAILMGWVGQHSGKPVSLESFKDHLKIYGPKIFNFYKHDHVTGPEFLKVFEDDQRFQEILFRLAERTQILENVEIRDGYLKFNVSSSRLKQEVEVLKQKGIHQIVSLTEDHHNTDILGDHFKLHHLSIQDLGAPTLSQVEEFVEILKQAQKDKQVVAVHCLAGIGRTSTIIIAAHMLMGESLTELKGVIGQRNPFYTLAGSQQEFLHFVEKTRRAECVSRKLQ